MLLIILSTQWTYSHLRAKLSLRYIIRTRTQRQLAVAQEGRGSQDAVVAKVAHGPGRRYWGGPALS